MAQKYQKIRRTPGFLNDYSEIREQLKRTSPVACRALPQAMLSILDVIDNHPHSWPLRKKQLAGTRYEFHLAVTNIAYRRLHVRYFVDQDGISHLLTAWVDGQDEPAYKLASKAES